MKRVMLFIVMVFVLVSIVYAQEEFLYDRTGLELMLKVDTEIELRPRGSGLDVEYVRTYMSFFPKDNEQQDIITMSTLPQAEAEGERLVYYWEEPTLRELEYKIESIVKTKDFVRQVKGKVQFPIKVNPELEIYIKASEHIDSNNPEIIEKASELAEGEDDLFVVLFKLASWTEQNVKYDLSTLTADVSQKASWVLENKVGVCDELTSLFIAMARSLGIPAKFVSGLSYTTSAEFDENWLPHGWAEVYVPGHGWVAFDPTFGEYGYVDATHVKMQESLDPAEPASRYEWVGNVDLLPKETKFDVKIRNEGRKIAQPVKLESEALRNEVGFGSYNVIKTEVENLKDYYVATTLRVASSKEVELEKDKVQILLKPREKKQAYWLVKVDELGNGFIYTLPVLVHNERNASSLAQFRASEDGKVYSKKEAENFVTVEEEEKTITQEIELKCNVDKEKVYLGEKINVECSVKNLGNIVHRNAELCIGKECEGFELHIGEEKKIEKKIAAQEVGKNELSVVFNGAVKKSLFLQFDVLDQPKAAVKSINYPATVGFDDEFELSFVVEKESFSVPKNVFVNVRKGFGEQEIGELNEPQRIILKIKGKYLKEGENTIIIYASWEDDAGKKFETQGEAKVTLGEFSLWQKFKGFFFRLGRFFSG